MQAKGYAIPDYPESPDSDEAIEIKKRYDSVKGSAVNPFLEKVIQTGVAHQQLRPMQKQIHIQWVLGTQKYVPRFPV